MREVNGVEITDEQAEGILMVAVAMVQNRDADTQMVPCQETIAEQLLQCDLITQKEYDQFVGLDD